MVKHKNEYKRWIIDAEDALPDFKIGHATLSEPKIINTLEFTPGLFILDTPGLEDTEGATVDICNTLGIPKAVSKCNSVKPILLISYDLLIAARG